MEDAKFPSSEVSVLQCLTCQCRSLIHRSFSHSIPLKPTFVYRGFLAMFDCRFRVVLQCSRKCRFRTSSFPSVPSSAVFSPCSQRLLLDIRPFWLEIQALYLSLLEDLQIPWFIIIFPMKLSFGGFYCFSPWRVLGCVGAGTRQVAGLLDALLYRTTKRWKGKAHI